MNDVDYEAKFADRVKGIESSIIRDIFRKVYKTNTISLAGGSPDLDSLPTEFLLDITQKVLTTYGKQVLQYGLTEGFEPLRRALISLLLKRSIKTDWESIFITSGAQGALNTIAMAFINAGDKIAVESPTFLGALKTFQAYQAKIQPIEVDEFGIVPKSLVQCLKENDIKFLYLVPTFQNPTGYSMSLSRKKQIAEIVIKHNLIVIEDDPYYELRYSGDDIQTLFSFAPDNVIYVGSLSKIFSPGMRLGYFIAPKEINRVLLSLKQGIDLHASVYSQAIVAIYLQDGYLDEHLVKIKRIYKSRLTAILNSLQSYFPPDFTWSKPEGGMFVWVTGPHSFDVHKLYSQAIENGVAFVPGRPFFVNEKGGNCFRLSFTNTSEVNINSAILALSKLIRN